MDICTLIYLLFLLLLLLFSIKFDCISKNDRVYLPHIKMKLFLRQSLWRMFNRFLLVLFFLALNTDGLVFTLVLPFLI